MEAVGQVEVRDLPQPRLATRCSHKTRARAPLDGFITSDLGSPAPARGLQLFLARRAGRGTRPAATATIVRIPATMASIARRPACIPKGWPTSLEVGNPMIRPLRRKCPYNDTPRADKPAHPTNQRRVFVPHG